MKARNPLGIATSVAMFLALSACTTPPSVSPLLRLAQRAMHAEADRILADTERDAERFERVRASLSAAFDADLRQRGELDAAWVRDAAEVYAAARAALARQEAALAHARDQRARNLATAAAATGRALRILERRDALVTGATGVDLWEMVDRMRVGE